MWNSGIYMSLYARGAQILQKSWIQIKIIGAMKQVSCVGHKYKVQWQCGSCDLCTPSLAVDIQEDGNLQNGGCSYIP